MKRVSPATPLKITALHLVGWLTRAQAAVTARARSRWRTNAPADRLLVVRLDETIGDNVMFSAFLRELRRGRPEAHITLVAHAARRDVFEHCPDIDRLVLTPFGSGATKRLLLRPLLERRWCRAHLLDAGSFAVAFVPRPDYDHHAVFLAAASGADCIVGYPSTASARKRVVARGIDRLLDRVVEWKPHMHETDRALAVLEAVGIEPLERQTEMWIGDEANAEADAAIAVLGGRPYAVLAPSGGHSVLKPWPPARYDEAAQALLAEGLAVVVIGAAHDRHLVSQLRPGTQRQLIDLTGRLSVMGTASVIKSADLFLGSDSGMSHVAGAVGTRTLAVFGPGCPHTFGPRGPLASAVTLDLECCPCHSPLEIDQCVVCIHDEPICMTQLDAARVLAERETHTAIVNIGGRA